MNIVELPISEIHVDEMFNARLEIDPTSCQSLADSISKNGLLSPLLVREATPDDNVVLKYILLAGFRRLIAVKHRLGWKTVKCNLIDSDQDDDTKINLIENLERQQLTIIEEANAVLSLYNKGLGQTEIGNKLHRTRQWVTNRLRFSHLSKPVQLMVLSGTLNLKEALSLTEYKAEDEQVYRAYTLQKKRDIARKSYLNFDKPATAKSAFLSAKNLYEFLLLKGYGETHQRVIAALGFILKEIPVGPLFELLELSGEELSEFRQFRQ